MSNAEIDIKLNAKNSNGDSTLWLQVQDVNGENEYYFTLCGDYKGKKIQIDFDEITKTELEEMKIAIELILKS